MTSSADMMELIVGSWAARAVHTAVELGLPERLAPGPVGPAPLAEATGTAEPALRRLLDYLTALGVCKGDAEGGYALGELGTVLLADSPGSVRDYALLAGTEFYPVWGRLTDAVRTGEPVFEQVFGEPLYSYLDTHDEAARRFGAAMNSGTVVFEQVPAVYDFSRAGRIVDVAGGNGELLATILAAVPGPAGLLYENPSATAEAEARLRERGLAERCDVVGGDMFASVPAGGDVYLLSRVLVNHDDDEAAALLSRCAQAMAPGAELLLVERPQAEGAPNRTAAAIDLLMMLVTSGGRSRTVERMRALLRTAGLEPGAVRELPRGFALLAAGKPGV